MMKVVVVRTGATEVTIIEKMIVRIEVFMIGVVADEVVSGIEYVPTFTRCVIATTYMGDDMVQVTFMMIGVKDEEDMVVDPIMEVGT